MMAFAIKDTLTYLQTHLMTTGWFSNVMLGEPKGAMSTPGIVAAIWMNNVTMMQLTLNGTIEQHVCTVRLYEHDLDNPNADIDLGIEEAVVNYEQAVFADFTLGDTVRRVDVAGEGPASWSVDFGDIPDLGGIGYRVADITVPVIVDDSASLVA